MRTSVFLISELNTSDPTMGQKGTFEPSSCAMASAMAVLPIDSFNYKFSNTIMIIWDRLYGTHFWTS